MIIEKSAIAALLADIAKDCTVYVPSVVDGTSRFCRYDEGVDVRLDLLNTKLPPKDLLFPATERMYRWSRGSDGLSIESEAGASEPFVVFGARPCDVASIERMDDVFLTKGYVDEFYQARRQAMTLVAIACAKPGPACFCDSMGASPNAAPAADVLLCPVDATYEVYAQTPKGEALVAGWQIAAKNVNAQNQAPANAQCSLKVSMDGVAQALPSLFDSELWQEVANTCLTCGTCTFVCPTCHCFDISQQRRANEGERFRCWDSCMFSDYTLMAGNHNPRATKASRVRQRFMHKLCYFQQRYGSPLCVGCGRCMSSCPAGVDIVRIIERVGELKSVAAGSVDAADAKEAANG